MSHSCGPGCADAGTPATQSLDETLFTSAKSIHHAITGDDLARAERLLRDRPGRVGEVDGAGYVPVLYARSPAAIRLLHRHGADLSSSTTPEGHRTLLHKVAGQGNVALVRCLLDLGQRSPALLTRRDREGRLAVDLARSNGHNDVVRLLLRPHCDSST